MTSKGHVTQVYLGIIIDTILSYTNDNLLTSSYQYENLLSPSLSSSHQTHSSQGCSDQSALFLCRLCSMKACRACIATNEVCKPPLLCQTFYLKTSHRNRANLVQFNVKLESNNSTFHEELLTNIINNLRQLNITSLPPTASLEDFRINCSPAPTPSCPRSIL